MPVFEDHSRILFQGDSITDGSRGRTADPNHILGHGYVFILAAGYGAELPERHLEFINRGISGNTVNNLLERWQKDTLDLKPTILSIVIGVNDLGNDISPGDYEAQYGQLLDRTYKALPKIKIILGEPFGLPTGPKKNSWTDYQKKLEKFQDAVTRLGEKYHIPVVHFQRVFNDALHRAPADYWIWDGVHPTYCGHQLLADEWARVVAQSFSDVSNR